VINKEEETRFKRMIFRVTKGNVWMTIMDIDAGMGQRIIDPLTVTYNILKKKRTNQFKNAFT